MAPSPKLHAALHGATGGGCLAGALLIQLAPEAALHWQLLKEPLLAAGLVTILLGALRRRPTVGRLSTGLCLSLLSLAFTFAVLEIGLRLARFDFRRIETARRRLPPFYRKPMVPTGGAFFRRPGPDRWQGQTIRTCLRILGLPDDPYRDEPAVDVRYDSLGFRNEPRGEAWDIAVAGDSFTELGFLASGQLFTEVLARRTGQRVLNLGVSHTGPLTHLSYLADYGLSPATRRVLIVFYEGNDLTDLDRERRALEEFERTGSYDPEEHRRQSSLLRALAEWVGGRRDWPVKGFWAVDAIWPGPTGEVAISLDEEPPAEGELAPETVAAFERFLSPYAAFGRTHQLRTWLAYMPCKARVLHGRVRLTENGLARFENWHPPALPDWVAKQCAQADVRFIDLTPPLIEALETRRQLPYNALYDTHLNAFGSEIVGQTLARALGPEP